MGLGPIKAVCFLSTSQLVAVNYSETAKRIQRKVDRWLGPAFVQLPLFFIFVAHS